MDKRRALVLLMAVIALAIAVGPASAFIGAGINLNKHIGNTVNFNLNPTLVQAAGLAQGLEAINLGVTYGVNYDINSLAGYPFGYGGVGAITDANVGYGVGVSMNELHGAAFDGSSFGIPEASQTLTATKYDNFIGAQEHLANEQYVLPWAVGFPAL